MEHNSSAKVCSKCAALILHLGMTPQLPFTDESLYVTTYVESYGQLMYCEPGPTLPELQKNFPKTSLTWSLKIS